MIRYSRISPGISSGIRDTVEGDQFFTEVSRVVRNGVYLYMTHRNTGIQGHMSREDAIAMRDALNAALVSSWWERYDDRLD